MDNDSCHAAHPADAHLPSSALALCCSLNDTGQIQQLDLGVVVVDDTRDACQRGELIRSCLRVCACELGQQGGLSNRGETCVAGGRKKGGPGGGGCIRFASIVVLSVPCIGMDA